MSRIRTVKPEFWTSEQVVELSPTARLLFIGIWNFCDDQGIHPASAKTLKMEVFPGDDFSVAEIESMVSEILNQGLMLEYQAVDGKYYWHVTGWTTHQKVEKPNKKYPTPPDFADHSPTIRRPLPDQTPEEGKGREGKGREKEGRGGVVDERSATPPHPPTPPATGFEKIRNEIQKWQDADGGESLKKIASDQKYLGQIEPEITRFITNNLLKDPYRTRIINNPLEFFLEQFPGWLCLPAAQRASRAQSQSPTANGSGSNQAYKSPVLRELDADLHRTRADAIALIQSHASGLHERFEERHITAVMGKSSQRAAIAMIESIKTTLEKQNGNAHEVEIPTA